MSNWNQEFGEELVIARNDATGIEVRSSTFENTCDYIRIVMTGASAEDSVNEVVYEGECELIYWDKEEWMTDDAMPSILCAIKAVGDGNIFEATFAFKAFE